MNLKKFLLLSTFSLLVFGLTAQEQPIEIPTSGYRFQYRIKGLDHKKSKILEVMVDEYGNYLVTTFRGEKASFVYVVVYNLYTWDEKYRLKMDDNRCELYNSFFDEEGEYLYVNVDVYRNKFKKVNLKTGEIEKVDCSETPKGCRKLEPQYYKLDAYTVGENYYVYRDEKFENYLKILVKKEMYIPKDPSEFNDMPGYHAGKLDPAKGGVIQLTPAQIRDLKAGKDVVYMGVSIFYDPNSLDENGKETDYDPGEGDAYRLRLTPTHLGKLEKKASFLVDKFVLKLDLEAWEEEHQ